MWLMSNEINSPENRSKLSNIGAGFAFMLFAALVFVAYQKDVSLFLAIPLGAIFSIGVASFIEGIAEGIGGKE